MATAVAPASSRVVRGACPHDCPDTCAMLVTVEDGRATRVAGDPDHPFTQGFLCAKVNRYIERTYHRDRLLHPLRRVGPEGQRTVRADLVGRGARRDRRAARARSRASADGPQAILPYSYAGTMGLVQGSSMDRRFFHLLGASQLDRTICSMAGTVGHADDGRREHRRRRRRDSARAISCCSGARTRSRRIRISGRSCSRRASAARRSSAIDPIRTRTAAQCDEWIADPARHRRRARARDDARAVRARPRGRDYLERHTLGHEAAARARGASGRRSASRAITGHCRRRPSSSLGERYGRATRGVHSRELRSAAPRRRRHGRAQRSRACRRSTGHWRRAGGGVQLSIERELPVQQARRSSGPTSSPPARTINMIRLGEALTTPDAGVGGPPVQRARRLQLATRPRSRPTATPCCAGSRARICSPSCSSISRPTPPTRPTSCCRRRRSSSTGTCISRTAITTSRSTSRRSSRSARRCRTARSSAASPRGWGWTDPCSARRRRRR